MAVDNQFRINELIASGSRAIISKDSSTGNHTFVQGSDTIILGKSEGGDAPYTHLKGERDGEVTGRIEKPKYNEEELVKAVDTKVDELIGRPKKPQPDVVPRPVYEDLRRLYNDALARISELENLVSELEARIAQLEAENEALKIENDALQLRTATAENEAQSANQRYGDLLKDFSNAIIKGTRDAIERVSLKAQVEGLRAQKETLRQQLKSLNLIIGQLQAQVEAEQVRQAASEALEGVVGTYEQKTNTGWKLPQSEIKKQDKQLYLEIYTRNNQNDIRVVQGTAINVYNFNEEEPQTFTASSNVPWLKVGGPITVDPREGNEAGKGYIGVQWSRGPNTSKRKLEIPGTVTITASPSGEQHTISAIMFKEIQRLNKEFTRGSTQSAAGSEKS